MSVLFYTFFTIMVVPADALGWELTPDYAERTRVMSWFSSVVKIALMVMPWMFALTQAPFWASEQQGLQIVGAVFGGLFIFTGLLPAIFCRERNYQLATKEGRQPFLQTLKMTLGNRTILLVYAFVVAALLGGTAFGLFGTHLAVYYLYGGDKARGAAFFGTISVIGSVVGLLAIAAINRWYIQTDKRQVVLASLAVAVAGWLSALFFISDSNPWLMIVPVAMNAIGVSGVFLLLGSILADVADDDELRNGYRREGAIGSFSSFCGKLSGTIPAVLGGALLSWVGFDGKLPVQSETTLAWMRGMVIFFPILGFSAAFFFMWRYPLSKDKMLAVRAELERRRGSVLQEANP
jgi:GPH family glycoside/pentoside/hexuronide:cation symporter